MNIQNGTYKAGNVICFESEEWTPGKFNHTLRIRQTYVDRYGQESGNYDTISIQNDDVERIKKFAADNAGKRVLVPVVVRLRTGTSNSTGKPYAFNDVYLPKGAVLTPLVDQQ